MIIHLIAIGKSMPDWVSAGFHEYASRLPNDFTLKLTEIPAKKRSKSTSIDTLKNLEGEALLTACATANFVIALDEDGQQWPSTLLAQKFQQWRENHREIALLVGGPDGLSEAVLERADLSWSLSKLTLPHPMVRVIIAEQIYRLYSIISHHPYHRD